MKNKNNAYFRDSMGCPILPYNDFDSPLKVVHRRNSSLKKEVQGFFISLEKSSVGTISDRKLGIEGTTPGVLDHYTADVISYNLTYPYGASMPGMSGNTSEMRYSYQGSEKDDEISGDENTYTTYYRMLSVRNPRWWSPDPKASELPHQSPYCSMDNNPIWFNDPMGDKVDGDYRNKNGDLLGSDGIDDGKVHYIDENDFNKVPKILKSEAYAEALSKYVITTNLPEPPVTSSDDGSPLFNEGIALASLSYLMGKQVDKTNAILSSRSGYTSGSYKGKVYNKSKVAKTGAVLKYGGFILTAYSVIDTKNQYDNGEITKERRDFNYINSGVGTVFPQVGIPIAVGDYYGQKYNKEITNSVSNDKATLNKTMSIIIELMGIQTKAIE